MSRGFANPIIGGGGSLVYPSIHSPNFTASPLTGWSIDQTGNLYAGSATIEGTITGSVFEGTDFVINSAGAFFYSAAPAAGNLIASITSTSGTDDGYGNAYMDGLTVYNLGAGLYTQIVKGNGVYMGETGYTDFYPAQLALTGATFTAGEGAAVLYSPLETSTDVRSWIAVEPGPSGGLGAILFQGQAVCVNGIYTVNPANGSAIETWTELGAPTASGLSVWHARYRMSPLGGVEFDFVATWTGTTGFVSNFPNTLPAAYQPKYIKSFPVGLNTGITALGNNWPRIEINGGTVSLGLPPGGSGVHASAHFIMYLD